LKGRSQMRGGWSSWKKFQRKHEMQGVNQHWV
jgi:hypothetical protein